MTSNPRQVVRPSIRRPSPLAINTLSQFRETDKFESLLTNAVGDLSLKKQTSTPLYNANKIGVARATVANPIDLESDISELPGLNKNPSFFLDFKPTKIKREVSQITDRKSLSSISPMPATTMPLERKTSTMPIFDRPREHELIEDDQLGNIRGCNDMLVAQQIQKTVVQPLFNKMVQYITSQQQIVNVSVPEQLTPVLPKVTINVEEASDDEEGLAFMKAAPQASKPAAPTNVGYPRTRHGMANEEAAQKLLSGTADKENASVNKREAKADAKKPVTAVNTDVLELTKKRGRKREAWRVFVENSRVKIADCKLKLKTAKADGLDVKERVKLRNVASAQHSRLKKKAEVRFLNSIIHNKDAGISAFFKVVVEELIEAGQTALLTKILMRSQSEISSVDQVVVEEFKELQAILDDVEVDMATAEDDDAAKKPQQRSRRKVPKRPLVAPEPLTFTGDATDADQFFGVMNSRLISSDAVLTHFQHNDEKDEVDYQNEAKKSNKR